LGQSGLGGPGWRDAELVAKALDFSNLFKRMTLGNDLVEPSSEGHQ
jgi:hypothetical protein